MNDKTLKAVIIDDENACIESLILLLNRFAADIEVVGTANSVESGVLLIQNSEPDIVFLDINMPPLSAFDLLKEFQNPNFEIIFCTAHDDYAIQAIK